MELSSASKPKRFAGLEGLRGVAALLILAFHLLTYDGGLHTAHNFVRQLGAHLEIGVPIFFILSGFLLYRPWVIAEATEQTAPDARRYFRRRLARIVPAYWVALSIAAALGITDGSVSHAPWIYYGFLQTYSVNTIVNGLAPVWSLCVEFSFYLALPVIAFVATRWVRSARWQAVGAVLAVIGSLCVRALSVKAHDPILSLTLLGTIDWFVIGMALSKLVVTRHAALRALTPRRALAGAALAYAALVLLKLPFGGAPWPPQTRPWVLQHALYGACAASVFAAALAAEFRAGLLNRVLTNGGAQWLGRVSYGVFLWHVPAIYAAKKLVAHGYPSSFAAQSLLVLVLTLGAATASWYGVERWVLASRFARGRTERAPAPATVSAERGTELGLAPLTGQVDASQVASAAIAGTK